MSLERATALAFQGRLKSAARELDRPWMNPTGAREIWIRAYIAAARGDFDDAERLARSLLTTSRVDPETRARAAATLGSVLRQTERHSDARHVERVAVRRAPRGEPRAHLLIGLAADAVGLGLLDSVDDVLRRIGRTHHGWRPAIRLAWVRCERELLAGRPGRAARSARAAAAASARHGARRHEAKSLLFLGAALLEAEGRGAVDRERAEEAVRALRRARSIAGRIGARPIVSVATSLFARSRLGARG